MIDWRDSLTEKDLPPQIRALAEVVGALAALEVCKAFSGLTIYIPSATHAAQVLAEPSAQGPPFDSAQGPPLNQRHRDFLTIATCIGQAAALALAERYNGAFVYVPKLDELLRARRNDEIRRERDQGAEYRYLALKYAITERWVREILDHREDTRQLALF